MTLRQLGDELAARGTELTREALYALAKLVPGGTKQSLRPGAIPQWVFPDDAADRITPELIDQAIAEARSAFASSVPSSAPARAVASASGRAALGDDELEVQRMRLRLERDRLELDRLELEARRSEIERRRSGAATDGAGAVTFMLQQKLGDVERKLDDVARATRAPSGAGSSATLLQALAPLMPQIIAKLGVQPDVAGVVRELKDLGVLGNGGSPLTAARELAELVGVLQPLLRGGRGGDAGGALAELARALAPRVPDLVGKVTDTVRDYVRARVHVEEIRARGRSPRPAATSPTAPLVAVLNEISPAAQVGDERAFPALLEALTNRVPGCAQLLEDVRQARVTSIDAFDALRAIGIATAEPLTSYLQRFLAWVAGASGSSAPTPPPTAPGPGPSGAAPAATVLGRCERCRAEYHYERRTDLEGEHQPCDATNDTGQRCGGRIVPAEIAA